MLLGAADIALDARVAALDDVTGASLVPFVAGEIPVHHVPPAGAEAELDRRGVHDDAVAHRDRARELRERVRPLGAVAEIDLDPLETGALLEQPHDLARSKRRHRVTGALDADGCGAVPLLRARRARSPVADSTGWR